MRIRAVKTKIFRPPQETIDEELQKALPRIEEGSIVVIASKIVSIHQGRTTPVSSVSNKDSLIKKEAELYLERVHVPGEYVMHTVRDNVIIPSAGIDESNSDEHYILWPNNPMETADYFLKLLKRKTGVRNAGVIISDSRSVFLRRGVIGIALGFAGFKPLYDYRGTNDIFGKEIKSSQINIPDALSACAVYTMGEGAEQTPIAVISDIPYVRFIEGIHSLSKRPFSTYFIKKEEDLYFPFIKNLPWKKGGKKR